MERSCERHKIFNILMKNTKKTLFFVKMLSFYKSKREIYHKVQSFNKFQKYIYAFINSLYSSMCELIIDDQF